ncbi:MAG TPA: biotin--[acetyl-CoA-carboxylase] ligase [Acidimicrobiales bacterium]|nr:biotin--[acetyl-CoA-carboxylase] ligase [Acidimicrobiales bacterium]
MSVAPLFAEVAAPARTRFGPIRRFAEIDSTNRYLLGEARAGAPEGTVAVADYQSAGRGRLGRRWEAPPRSNLLVSILLRPILRIDELHLCTVAVALAAAAACERGAGVVPALKWPNDLLVGNAKLGGILAEALPAGAVEHGAPAQSAVVVGLGLNVGWPPPDDPADTTPDVTPAAPPAVFVAPEVFATPATSIRREAGSAPEPVAVLGLVLEELEGRLVDLADSDGRRRLASEYRRRCVTVGRAVRVSLPDEVFTGTATDITLEGHLMVDVGACLRTIAAGDVVHLRDQA